jgi:hypothetical protein
VTVDVEKQEVRFGDRVIKATIPAGPRNQLVGGTWASTAVLLKAGAAIQATARRLPYVGGVLSSSRQPEVFQRDPGARAQALDRSSGKPLGFPDWRQVDEFRRVAVATPQVDDFRSELGKADDVLRVAVSAPGR